MSIGIEMPPKKKSIVKKQTQTQKKKRVLVKKPVEKPMQEQRVSQTVIIKQEEPKKKAPVRRRRKVATKAPTSTPLQQYQAALPPQYIFHQQAPSYLEDYTRLFEALSLKNMKENVKQDQYAMEHQNVPLPIYKEVISQNIPLVQPEVSMMEPLPVQPPEPVKEIEQEELFKLFEAQEVPSEALKSAPKPVVQPSEPSASSSRPSKKVPSKFSKDKMVTIYLRDVVPTKEQTAVFKGMTRQKQYEELKKLGVL